MLVQLVKQRRESRAESGTRELVMQFIEKIIVEESSGFELS